MTVLSSLKFSKLDSKNNDHDRFFCFVLDINIYAVGCVNGGHNIRMVGEQRTVSFLAFFVVTK
jgi:hypothetical protein